MEWEALEKLNNLIITAFKCWYWFQGLPMWLSSQKSSCQCRRLEFDPEPGRCPAEGKAAHSSILAWETHEQRSLTGYTQSRGSQKELVSTSQLNNNKVGFKQSLFKNPHCLRGKNWSSQRPRIIILRAKCIKLI